jgi:hypothetical protein
MTPSEREPMVIVDFVFEDGLFFIAVKNISANPVYDVSVTFDKKFTGVEGAKDISSLRLFRNIPFLAPQKEIVAFLDTSASYFRRRQPTNIRVYLQRDRLRPCGHRRGWRESVRTDPPNRSRRAPLKIPHVPLFEAFSYFG